MATEKRLIDVNALKAIFDKRYDDAFMQERTRTNGAWWDGYATGVNWGRNTITDIPALDAVEVVRCKDCRFRKSTFNGDGYFCSVWDTDDYEEAYVKDNDYCSYGERKDN